MGYRALEHRATWLLSIWDMSMYSWQNAIYPLVISCTIGRRLVDRRFFNKNRHLKMAANVLCKSSPPPIIWKNGFTSGTKLTHEIQMCTSNTDFKLCGKSLTANFNFNLKSLTSNVNFNIQLEASNRMNFKLWIQMT